MTAVNATYQEFATALSALLIVLYLGLLVVAIRRTRVPFRLRETVRTHARFVEGPTVLLLLIVSVLLLISATRIADRDYLEVLKYVGAGIRGSMLAFGAYLAALYWLDRDTWWPSR